MRLRDRLRGVVHNPADDRWPTPEPLRQSLRIVFQLVGLVIIASIISLAAVFFVPLALKYKAILFCALGFAIYVVFVVRTSKSRGQPLASHLQQHFDSAADMDDELDTNEPDEAKDLDREQYAMGAKSHSDGEPFDSGRSAAWQLGWECGRLNKPTPDV